MTQLWLWNFIHFLFLMHNGIPIISRQQIFLIHLTLNLGLTNIMHGLAYIMHGLVDITHGLANIMHNVWGAKIFLPNKHFWLSKGTKPFFK